jgi:hypothetical protein
LVFMLVILIQRLESFLFLFKVYFLAFNVQRTDQRTIFCGNRRFAFNGGGSGFHFVRRFRSRDITCTVRIIVNLTMLMKDCLVNKISIGAVVEHANKIVRFLFLCFICIVF